MYGLSLGLSVGGGAGAASPPPPPPPPPALMAFGLSPRTLADDATSSSADLDGWTGELAAEVQVGSLEPGTTVTVTFEEQTGNGVWTAATSGPAAVAASHTKVRTVVARTKRYLRCLMDLGGDVPQADVAVMFCGRVAPLPSFVTGLSPRTLADDFTGAAVAVPAGAGDPFAAVQLGNLEEDTVVTVEFDQSATGVGGWSAVTTDLPSLDGSYANRVARAALSDVTQPYVRCRLTLGGAIPQADVAILIGRG